MNLNWWRYKYLFRARYPDPHHQAIGPKDPCITKLADALLSLIAPIGHRHHSSSAQNLNLKSGGGLGAQVTI